MRSDALPERLKLLAGAAAIQSQGWCDVHHLYQGSCDPDRHTWMARSTALGITQLALALRALQLETSGADLVNAKQPVEMPQAAGHAQRFPWY